MNSRPLPVCWRWRSPSKRRRGSVDMALNSVILLLHWHHVIQHCTVCVCLLPWHGSLRYRSRSKQSDLCGSRPRRKNAVVNEPRENWLGKDSVWQKEEHMCMMSMWYYEWTFVESRKYIMLSYSGLCQRRRRHCNRTTYCSLFFLVL